MVYVGIEFHGVPVNWRTPVTRIPARGIPTKHPKYLSRLDHFADAGTMIIRLISGRSNHHPFDDEQPFIFSPFIFR